MDFEFGFYTGDAPPKNPNAGELDIDAGAIGGVIGDTGSGHYIGITVGPPFPFSTPGIVFSPGGGVDLEYGK